HLHLLGRVHHVRVLVVRGERARAEVALVADAVLVLVGGVARRRHRRALVDGVAVLVAVAVGLLGVVGLRRVVAGVREAVEVLVLLALRRVESSPVSTFLTFETCSEDPMNQPAPPAETVAAIDAHGARVQGMFSDIARGYDRANRWMSLGIDVLWRRRAVAEV